MTRGFNGGGEKDGEQKDADSNFCVLCSSVATFVLIASR